MALNNTQRYNLTHSAELGKYQAANGDRFVDTPEMRAADNDELFRRQQEALAQIADLNEQKMIESNRSIAHQMEMAKTIAYGRDILAKPDQYEDGDAQAALDRLSGNFSNFAGASGWVNGMVEDDPRKNLETYIGMLDDISRIAKEKGNVGDYLAGRYASDDLREWDSLKDADEETRIAHAEKKAVQRAEGDKKLTDLLKNAVDENLFNTGDASPEEINAYLNSDPELDKSGNLRGAWLGGKSAKAIVSERRRNQLVADNARPVVSPVGMSGAGLAAEDARAKVAELGDDMPLFKGTSGGMTIGQFIKAEQARDEWIRRRRVLKAYDEKMDEERRVAYAKAFLPTLTDPFDVKIALDALNGEDLSKYKGYLTQDNDRAKSLYAITSVLRPKSDHGAWEDFFHRVYEGGRSGMYKAYQWARMADANLGDAIQTATGFLVGGTEGAKAFHGQYEAWKKTLAQDIRNDLSYYKTHEAWRPNDDDNWIEQAVKGLADSSFLQGSALVAGGAKMASVSLSRVQHPYARAASTALNGVHYVAEALGAASMVGEQFENMLMNGVDPERAATISLFAGAVDWYVERMNIDSYLGLNLSPAELRRSGIRALVKAAAKKDPALMWRMIKTDVKHAMQIALSESGEELIQGWNQAGALKLAQGDSADVRSILGAYLQKDTIRDGVNSFIEALPTCTAFGVMGAGSVMRNGLDVSLGAYADLRNEVVRRYANEVKLDTANADELNRAKHIVDERAAKHARATIGMSAKERAAYFEKQTDMSPSEAAFYSQASEYYNELASLEGQQYANSVVSGEINYGYLDKMGFKPTFGEDGNLSSIRVGDDEYEVVAIDGSVYVNGKSGSGYVRGKYEEVEGEKTPNYIAALRNKKTGNVVRLNNPITLTMPKTESDIGKTAYTATIPHELTHAFLWEVAQSDLLSQEQKDAFGTLFKVAGAGEYDANEHLAIFVERLVKQAQGGFRPDVDVVSVKNVMHNILGAVRKAATLGWLDYKSLPAIVKQEGNVEFTAEQLRDPKWLLENLKDVVTKLNNPAFSSAYERFFEKELEALSNAMLNPQAVAENIARSKESLNAEIDAQQAELEAQRAKAIDAYKAAQEAYTAADPSDETAVKKARKAFHNARQELSKVNAKLNVGNHVRHSLADKGTSRNSLSPSADGHEYTYEYLTSLPDMKLTKVDPAKFKNYKSDAERIADAHQSVLDAGGEKIGNAYYIKLDGENVLVSNAGIKHRGRRRNNENDILFPHLGEVLNNAVRVNEFNPDGSDKGVNDVLVYIGAMAYGNEIMPVRIQVNHFGNVKEVSQIDVLKSLNTKVGSFGSQGESSLDGTIRLPQLPNISIANLIGIAQPLHPNIFSRDVADKLGVKYRGDEVNARYSLVTDKNVLDEFNDPSKYIETYRTFQVVDGKLYSPMAAKMPVEVVGKNGKKRTKWEWTDPIDLGKAYKSDERPDIAVLRPSNGKYYVTLNKGNGSSLAVDKNGDGGVAYNPYWHSSNLVLNDQFTSAWNRPNLVTVKCRILKSDIESGYHAEKAHDPVGRLPWHVGPVAAQLENETRDVYLSQYLMPVEIMKDSDVAKMYKDAFAGKDIAVPEEVVPPNLARELRAAGVTVTPRKDSTRHSLVTPEQDAAYADAVKRGDMESAQRMVVEAAKKAMPDTMAAYDDGTPIVFIHGSDSVFNEFDEKRFRGGVLGNGFYFAQTTDNAYSNNQRDFFLDIKNGYVFDVKNKKAMKKILAEMKRRGADVDIGAALAKVDEIIEDDGENYAPEYDAPMSIVYSFGTHQGKEGPTMFQQIMKDWGYDGVYDVWTGDAVAFYPNQIKSADPVTYDDDGNLIPLSQRFNANNTDIRYSIANGEWEALERNFGVTENPLEAGWMLPNGKMLDFSGAHWTNDRRAPNPNHRMVDHADVKEAIDRDFGSNWEYRNEMLNSGAIRLMPEIQALGVAKDITEEQEDTIYDYVYGIRGGDEITVEFYDDDMRSTNVSTFNGKASPRAIINAIHEHFNVGSRYSLILGEKGARQFEENGKIIDNLDVAREMLGDREWKSLSEVDKVKIKFATGWEMGADGKWRYEIPDLKNPFGSESEYVELQKYLKDRYNEYLDDTEKLSKMWLEAKGKAAEKYGENPWMSFDKIREFLPKEYDVIDNQRKMYFELVKKRKLQLKKIAFPKTKLTIGDFAKGTMLEKAYPELMDKKVTIKSIRGNSVGMVSGGEIIIDSGESPSEAFKTVTHEIQHMIQEVEGFARGGNERFDGKDGYRRLAGEVEARNAEKRIGFMRKGGVQYWVDRMAESGADPSTVHTWLLEQTEDVDRDSQVVLTDFATSARQVISAMQDGTSSRYSLAEKEGPIAKAQEAERDRFSLVSYGEAAGIEVRMENEAPEFYHNGNRISRNGGKLFVGAQEVTDGVIEQWVDSSPIGALLRATVGNGYITEENRASQLKFFSGLLGLFMRNRDVAMTQQFVGSMLFTGMKENSDKQYKTTFDFPSICTKTQAVIDSMSAAAVAKAGGLTSDEILKIYRKVAANNLPVPCPECYVFSRWIGVGGLLDNIHKYQQRFGSMPTENVRAQYATFAAQIEAVAEKNGLSFGKAKGKLGSEFTKQYKKLLDKVEKARNQGEPVSEKDELTLEVIESNMDTVKAMTWIETVYFTDSSMTKRRDHFAVPSEVLFDLNRTEEFSRDYPQAWAFRCTQGAGYGKAITPYAEEVLGEGISIESNKKLIKDKQKWAREHRGERMPNSFLILDANGNLTKDALKKLANARKNEYTQAFIGGQRIQSTSDARPENMTDYIIALLEMQAMGSFGQGYTKVLGAIPVLNAAGFSMNMSLMPLGGGLDENGVPVDTKWGGVPLDKMKEYRAKYDHAGSITVGANDQHIRALMRQAFRDFIIPYHASGGKKEVVNEMRRIQERLDEYNREHGTHISFVSPTSTDYTTTQGEKILSDLRLAELGYSPEDIELVKKRRDARVAILTGKGAKDMDVIRGSKFLSHLYDMICEKDGEWYGVKVPKGIIGGQIFPNEYWNKSLTYDESAQITRDYLDYCHELGILHKFSGMKVTKDGLKVANGYDANGKRAPMQDLAYVYDADGNRTDEIEPFFWKVLIDRRMYDNDGKYIPQTRINLNAFDVNLATSFANYITGAVYDQKRSMEVAKEVGDDVRAGRFSLTQEEIDYFRNNDKTKNWEMKSSPRVLLAKAPERFDGIEPLVATSGNKAVRKAVKKLFRVMKEAKNSSTGDSVQFSTSSVGKMLGQSGANINELAPVLKPLFESAIYAWHEPEVRMVDHTYHFDNTGYRMYLNKFSLNGGEEKYIRFTVREKGKRVGDLSLHHATVSDVKIYNVKDAAIVAPVNKTGEDRVFTDDKISYFLSGVNAVNARFSLAGQASPTADMEYLIAHETFARNGEAPSLEEVGEMMRRAGVQGDPRQVLANALLDSNDMIGIYNGAANDPVISSALEQAGLAYRQRLAQSRAKRTMLKFDSDLSKHRDAIRKAYQSQVDNVTGMNYREMMTYYGLDMNEILKAMPPKPRKQSAEKETDEGSDGEQETPEVELSEAEKKAVDDVVEAIVTRGKNLAAQAENDGAASNREEENATKEPKKKPEGESDEDFGDADPEDIARGNAVNAAIMKAIKESGISISNPLAMVSLIRRLTEDFILRNPSTVADLDPSDVFKSRIALARLASNLSSFARAVAEGYAPSFARVRISRRCAELDAKGLTTLRQVESVGESIFNDLNQDIIRQTRNELMKKLHKGDKKTEWKGLDFYAKKHGVNMKEGDRVVSAFGGAYIKFLRRAVDMSEAAVEKRSQELEEMIDAFSGIEDAERFRDYENAKLELDILTAYGALRTKMPAQIEDASKLIMKFVSEDLEALEKRKEEFEKKRVELRDKMAAGVVGDPKLKGRDEDRDVGFMYSLMGMLEVRASILTSRCKDAAVRDDALAAFHEIEQALFHCATLEKDFVNTAREGMRNVVKDVFGFNGEMKFAKLLDTKLDEATCAKLDRGNQHTQWRIGNVMQMYVSVLQSDYAENIATHGRDGDYADQLRQVIERADPRLMTMIERMRQLYAEYGQTISATTMAVSGVQMQTPNPLYMPVSVRRPIKGKNGESRQFSAYAPALTPRVKHGLDFDQTADIMQVWEDRVRQSAHTVGYLELSPLIQGTMQSTTLLEKINSAWGSKAQKGWNDYVFNILSGSRPKGTSMDGFARFLSKTTSRMFMWGNLGSNLNQLSAVFTSALSRDAGGLSGVAKNVGMWALKPIQLWKACVDLTATRAFKGRYGSDLNAAVTAARREGKYGALKSVGDKVTDIGMLGLTLMDKVGVMTLANVYYSERKALEESGVSPDEASELAAEKLVLLADKTAQGTNAMNATDFQQNGGVWGNMFLQFKTAPLQQFQYEYAAWVDWKADPTNGAKARKLLAALVVNHILANVVPLAVASAMVAIYGAINDNDDPEQEREKLVARTLGQVFGGSYGAIPLLGTLVDSIGSFIGGFVATGEMPSMKLAVGGLPSDTAMGMVSRVVDDLADHVPELVEAVRMDSVDDIHDAITEMAKDVSSLTWAGRQWKRATKEPKRKPQGPKRR